MANFLCVLLFSCVFSGIVLCSNCPRGRYWDGVIEMCRRCSEICQHGRDDSSSCTIQNCPEWFTTKSPISYTATKSPLSSAATKSPLSSIASHDIVGKDGKTTYPEHSASVDKSEVIFKSKLITIIGAIVGSIIGLLLIALLLVHMRRIHAFSKIIEYIRATANHEEIIRKNLPKQGRQQTMRANDPVNPDDEDDDTYDIESGNSCGSRLANQKQVIKIEGYERVKYSPVRQNERNEGDSSTRYDNIQGNQAYHDYRGCQCARTTTTSASATSNVAPVNCYVNPTYLASCSSCNQKSEISQKLTRNPGCLPYGTSANESNTGRCHRSELNRNQCSNCRNNSGNRQNSNYSSNLQSDPSANNHNNPNTCGIFSPEPRSPTFSSSGSPVQQTDGEENEDLPLETPVKPVFTCTY